MRNYFLILILLSVGCANTTQNHNMLFAQTVEQILAQREGTGKYQLPDLKAPRHWPDLSPEHLLNQHQQRLELANQLAFIDINQLSAENKINYEIITAQLANQLDNFQFKSHFMPLLSESGFHSDVNFTIDNTQLNSEQEVEQYLDKLSALPKYFKQNIYWMKQGILTGLTQPQAVLAGYENSISAFIVDDVLKSPFYKPMLNVNPLINNEFIKQKQQQLADIITNKINPAYHEYFDFFTQKYYPNARQNIAITETLDGHAYYKSRIKHYTTTTKSADEIHQLGLVEVSRIKQEMLAIINKLGYQGSFAEFVHFLRTDPQFYATSAEELLKEASYIAKQMDAKLPSLFNHLPRVPYGVAPVPDSIAPKYTTGRYIGPNNDKQAGFYWLNTYALNKRPLYVLPALTLHEAVPGHHLQIMLNAELEHLPSYRRNAYISAFGEGWGLYSEWLGIEAGIYKNEYTNFGRLTYEMWRAARLVVDTGMHVKNWTRQQAIDYMSENTALSLHNVQTEIDRYISWPGQALSYKIGEITIKNLRKKAELALGIHFDVREFHHQILKNGSVPLTVLEDQIDTYINTTKAKINKTS